MVVRHEITERPLKMAFTERDYPIEAFLSDRAHEPLRMGIAVGCQEWRSNHSDTRGREEALDSGAPLPIAIADQHAIAADNPIDLVGQRAHRLDHKRLVGMRRGAEDMDTA
jgi:hypothetical protein